MGSLRPTELALNRDRTIRTSATMVNLVEKPSGVTSARRHATASPRVGRKTRTADRITKRKGADSATGTVVVRVDDETLRAQAPVFTEEKFHVSAAAPGVIFV